MKMVKCLFQFFLLVQFSGAFSFAIADNPPDLYAKIKYKTSTSEVKMGLINIWIDDSYTYVPTDSRELKIIVANFLKNHGQKPVVVYDHGFSYPYVEPPKSNFPATVTIDHNNQKAVLPSEISLVEVLAIYSNASGNTVFTKLNDEDSTWARMDNQIALDGYHLGAYQCELDFYSHSGNHAVTKDLKELYNLIQSTTVNGPLDNSESWGRKEDYLKYVHLLDVLKKQKIVLAGYCGC